MIPLPIMSTAELDELAGTGHAYHPLFELGRGGMARVYLAESHAFGVRKLVVLKVLNPELCTDPTMLASFRREAELSAQMNHPNVVQVMAVNEYLGAPAIVMEYLDGTPLSLVRKQAGKHLPLRLYLHVLSQVLGGLHYFHELKDLDGKPLNAVHRDVSPQNVMILHEGPVKVLDFGIAKISAPDSQTTRTGVVRGKLQYMSPEQLFGAAHVDRRTDIFAVGVMLWEGVANRRMWEGKTEIHVLRSLATGALPSLVDAAPQAPRSVLEIVKRATDLDRDNRFATAHEMRTAIEHAIEREGWLIQPHELADFMSQQFGESRRERELKIKSMLRALRGSDAKTDPASGTHLVSKRDERSSPPSSVARISELAVCHTLRPGRRSWGWIVAGTGCLVLLSGWALWRQTRPVEDPTASQAPRTVVLEVAALPRGAEILLDGRPLGRDRYAGQQPWTDGRALLEVRAPGHVSVRRELTLRRDMSLQFVLEPNPAAARPAVSTPPQAASVPLSAPSQSASPPSLDTPPPRTRVSSRSAARTTPKPKAASSGPSAARAAPKPKAVSSGNKRSRQCSPPYTFSADGVKRYKKECF